MFKISQYITVHNIINSQAQVTNAWHLFLVGVVIGWLLVGAETVPGCVWKVLVCFMVFKKRKPDFFLLRQELEDNLGLLPFVDWLQSMRYTCYT